MGMPEVRASWQGAIKGWGMLISGSSKSGRLRMSSRCHRVLPGSASPRFAFEWPDSAWSGATAMSAATQELERLIRPQPIVSSSEEIAWPLPTAT
jgi:hypothetical protein